MSKNVFINNLDTYVSRAIFKELRNDEPGEDGEPNPDAHNIFGTYLTKDSSSAPQGIKKMLKVSLVKRNCFGNRYGLLSLNSVVSLLSTEF